MKITDYNQLIKKRFLNSFGGTVVRYWSREDREEYHTYAEIQDIMNKQFEADLDVNNCIILFPVSIGFETCLFNNREIVIDHPANIVDVRIALNERGITYKNNIPMTADKYGQTKVSMLIIQDGIAYAYDKTANPNNFYQTFVDTKRHQEIMITDKDVKKLRITDKNIYFSGFFKHILLNEKVLTA